MMGRGHERECGIDENVVCAWCDGINVCCGGLYLCQQVQSEKQTDKSSGFFTRLCLHDHLGIDRVNGRFQRACQ